MWQQGIETLGEEEEKCVMYMRRLGAKGASSLQHKKLNSSG